jgi:hypothetical protein
MGTPHDSTDTDRIAHIRRAHAAAPPHQGSPAAPDGCCDTAFLLTQIDAYARQVRHWRANHAHLVQRNALLMQRPDLPVDRLPAYRELVRLQQALANQELAQQEQLHG